MSKGLPQSVEVNFGRDAQGIRITGNFLLIPAGALYVGGLKNEAEAPRRLAAITKPFYMQETPVTQRQYETVVGTNPSNFKVRPNNPVEQVSWHQSVAFAEQLSQQTKLKFRLPTEIEWEYSARGGDGDKYTFAGSNTLNDVGWYDGNAQEKTHPVKEKKPNGFGLYDMTGNVWEWCSESDYETYPNQELIDYQAVGSDELNGVSRGGSWYDWDNFTRITVRSGSHIGNTYDFLGFRLVLEAPHA